MKTEPRTDFEKPVVVTVQECCERCGNPKIHRDTMPPAGATWNPPSIHAPFPTKLPRHFTCWKCGWQWYPDGEARGAYVSREHRLANHDPGDEDRSVK